MTAVASPYQFQSQPSSRSGWDTISASQNGTNSMSQDEVGRIFIPGPRKTTQRTNSSTSLNSAISSTGSNASVQSNITATADGWGTRKKNNTNTRSIWPPGKSEPTAGLSTARPQSVSTTSSGASAASAISALHNPMLSSQQQQQQQQQMTNGQTQQTGVVRNGSQSETPALLYLLPMNGTFERKTISVPYYPDVLRVGRQTNAKTAPTPTNGFFDSKVLSRQHAEVYAERNGRIFIRDVKSSNGTFVNGKRLSPENKESEPHELREQDVLELGIDIVSEDQKTVVHHKVAARVEHAGIYSQGGDIAFGDLDPSGGYGAQQMKRGGSQGSLQAAKANALAAAAMVAREGNGAQQQGWKMWVQPITTEHIVKRLNRELTLARQQTTEMTRARQAIEGVLDANLNDIVNDEKKASHQMVKPSPIKNKVETKHFPEPPAPPPQQPLPQKPDMAKVLADPVIQPLLHRSDTARPGNMSPTRIDHSQVLLALTQELKFAKDQIPNLEERVQVLEQQLKAERSLRETAEERANVLEEQNSRKDSAHPSVSPTEQSTREPVEDDPEGTSDDLQHRLDRLHASMVDMKQQMELYRRRADAAEAERDESRKTLAEMVEERRRMNAEQERKSQLKDDQKSASEVTTNGTIVTNGHVKGAPHAHNGDILVESMLEDTGIDISKPLTRQQALDLRNLLSKVGHDGPRDHDSNDWKHLSYQGIPQACALSTVVVGLALMHYLNGWEKIQR